MKLVYKSQNSKLKENNDFDSKEYIKKESKLGLTSFNHPGNTPMRARIEVKHTMCTMCKKTSKLCHHS